MAKKVKERPSKAGSQRETAVEGNPAGGTSFAELIQHATGSQAPSRKEFESAMASRGYRSSDIRKLTKAFDQITQSGQDYFLRDEGFDVYNQGTRQSGSGRAKGNKAGADIGDIVGLGNNVSLLAGALRNEKSGYDQAKASKTASNQNIDPQTAQRAGQAAASAVNPLAGFAMTMRDLINNAGGPKQPETGTQEQGQQAQPTGQKTGKQAGAKKPGGIKKQSFDPNAKVPADYKPMDFDLSFIEQSPFYNPDLVTQPTSQGPNPNAPRENTTFVGPFSFGGGRGDGFSPEASARSRERVAEEERVANMSPKERKMYDANKKTQFFNDDMSFNTESLNPMNLLDPYAWAEATQSVKEGTSMGGSAMSTVGMFSRNPALAKVYNRYMLPFQAMGIGADWLADSMTEEGVDSQEMVGDAVMLGVNTLGANAGKIFPKKPLGLEQQMSQNARYLAPRTKFSLGLPSQMANKVQFPAMVREPAGLLPKYTPKLGNWGTPANLGEAGTYTFGF
jgi:hypothetical protein